MRTRMFAVALLAGACAMSHEPRPVSEPQAAGVSAPVESSAEPGRVQEPVPADDPRWARAEGFARDGGFALAQAEYEKLLAAAQGEGEQRWLEFRVQDCRWRALAATRQEDPTELAKARDALERMVRDTQRAVDRDRLWAEVQESLGDFHANSGHFDDSQRAWSGYAAALDWWAGSTDLERARRRYLDIVWRAATRGESGVWYGWQLNVPDEVLDNAVRIAESLEDRARAHVLRATALEQRGGD